MIESATDFLQELAVNVNIPVALMEVSFVVQIPEVLRLLPGCLPILRPAKSAFPVAGQHSSRRVL